MILPTKGITPHHALLSVGARILERLEQPKTISRLWTELRESNLGDAALRFDWFVLALDLLYTLGAVELAAGKIARTPGVAT